MRGRPPKPTEVKRRLGNPGKRRLPPAPPRPDYSDLVADLRRRARLGQLDVDEIRVLAQIATSAYDPDLRPELARELLRWNVEAQA